MLLCKILYHLEYFNTGIYSEFTLDCNKWGKIEYKLQFGISVQNRHSIIFKTDILFKKITIYIKNIVQYYI